MIRMEVLLDAELVDLLLDLIDNCTDGLWGHGRRIDQVMSGLGYSYEDVESGIDAIRTAAGRS